ncbi:MAG: hypothetical protein M1824_003759 [Vezdaea acicularis]|nr:MAG: hypothetical protein M1824_003759 [Vezdaea acicularis]
MSFKVRDTILNPRQKLNDSQSKSHETNKETSLELQSIADKDMNSGAWCLRWFLKKIKGDEQIQDQDDPWRRLEERRQLQEKTGSWRVDDGDLWQ